MTKGITGPEADPRIVYQDIISLPHPRSRKHPPMKLQDRAAQFAPFAALTGYEDMIEEEARLTEARIEPGEDAIERLNQALSQAARLLAEKKALRCTLTWFVPDAAKAGGKYITSVEEIRRIDSVKGCLILNRPEGRSGSFAQIDLRQLLEMELAPAEEPPS